MGSYRHDWVGGLSWTFWEDSGARKNSKDYQAYVSPITTVTGAETKGTFFFILNHNPETDPRTRNSFPQDVCLPCKQAGHWKRAVCFSVSLPVSLLPLGQPVSPLKEAQNRSCVFKKKKKRVLGFQLFYLGLVNFLQHGLSYKTKKEGLKDSSILLKN